MKKIFYLAGLMLFSSTAFSQALYPTKELSRSEANAQTVAPSASRVSAYSDTIWFDGFETPSTWTITGGATNLGWIISSAAGTNQGTWYFQNTRINSTTGGNWAVIAPSDPNSPTFNTATITTAAAIDISAYSNQNLVLSYEKYGARFLDTLKVEVSGDNMNWVTLDFNSDFAINSTASSYILPNPTSKDLFIPVSVVNSDSLYIRFNWEALSVQPGIGYGFFVDDIMVLNVPTNDIVMEQSAFFDDVRILYSWYYGAMPERQASTDSLTFSASFSNKGSADQPNTRLELSVSGPQTGTYVSPSYNSVAGTLGDTLRTSPAFALTGGQGLYSLTWNIVSDSVDQTPANNTRTVDLRVTPNEYSMAPLPISTANAFGKGGTATSEYILSQNYFFNVADTIYGLGVAFDSEWSRPDVIFQLSLIDNNDVVVAQSDFITSTQEMITDDMIYFSVPTTPIAAGSYDARIEVFSADSLFVVNCVDPVSPIEPAPGGGFFSRTTLSFGGSNFIDDMAYLTIRNNDNIVCNTTTNVSGIVNDSDPSGIGSIEITGVTGLGAPMYTYSWSGPSGYTSTTMTAENIAVQGTYTVTVTDVNRCTAVKSFDVAGKVDVNEISLDNNVALYPNPNNGEFTLALEGLNGAYTVSVKNVLGQVLSVETVNVSGGMNKTFANRNLNKGVYFVEVSDNNGASSVIRFVVE